MKHFFDKLKAIHNIIHSSEFKLAGKRIRKDKEFHFCNGVQPSSAEYYEAEFNECGNETFSCTRTKTDPTHLQRSETSQAEDCECHDSCIRESGQPNTDTPESSKIEDQNIM